MMDTITPDTSRHTSPDDMTPDELTPEGVTPVASAGTADRYLEPGWFTRHAMNPLVARLVKLGVSMKGARELQIRGRTSGEWRTTPVNLLELDGRTYLVAPRGQTQWVKNLRVAGGGRLRSGRQIVEFTAVDLAHDQKPVIVREYLRRWAWEVGQFFDGLSADSPDAEIAAAAPGFPVFELTIG
jgi:deazaflavin-dependent oxidoreductase (nitroreductase family)